jgi:hypothetical protein
LNAGPHACWAGALPHEPLHRPSVGDFLSLRMGPQRIKRFWRLVYTASLRPPWFCFSFLYLFFLGL